MAPGALLASGIPDFLTSASSSSLITSQARTNLGPLTTAFTQPTACSTAVGERSDQDLKGLLAQTCNNGQNPIDFSSCWPSTSSGAPSPLTPFQGWGFYSPGIICPAGHVSACTATGGAGGTSNWPVQFNLVDSETAVGCCPSDYTCGNAGGQTCSQVITTGSVPTVSCELGKSKLGLATVPETSAGITAMTLFAPMIQINWQSTDLPASTASPQGSPSSSQPLETSATAQYSTATPNLVGTQTVSADSAGTGGLETASSTGNVAQGPLSTSEATASGASGADNDADTDPTTNDKDKSSSNNKGSTFPVVAMVGVSVAGGLGAMGVGVWACYMWQRRRRLRKDTLQGINDDRMLQDLDHMYEVARPKTFDVAGRETMYELRRQDAYSSRPDSDMMYGPGQETSRFFRAGPQRSPQLVGHFAGVTTGEGGSSFGLKELPSHPGYGPYHRR